jgi:hypothetical protein
LFKLFQAVGFQRNEFDEELKTWKGYTYAQIRSHYKNVTLPSIQAERSIQRVAQLINR